MHVLSGSYEKSFLIENFKTHTKECNERGRKQTEGEAGQQMVNKARKGRKKRQEVKKNVGSIICLIVPIHLLLSTDHLTMWENFHQGSRLQILDTLFTNAAQGLGRSRC